MKANGYRLELFFLWLPDADLAVARVVNRVSQGGHGVPEETIRRRFEAGLRNSVSYPTAGSWTPSGSTTHPNFLHRTGRP